MAVSGERSVRARRSLCRGVALTAIFLVAALGLPSQVSPAGATPGGGNYLYFAVNPSNPVASWLYRYSNSQWIGSYNAGSGTSTNPSDNNPCNKNYTTDTGGYLPGRDSAGQLVRFNVTTPNGMTHANAPYGVGIQLNSRYAYASNYGYVHDCAAYPFSIQRTGLYVHRASSSGSTNLATYGCIKVTWASMDNEIHPGFESSPWSGAHNTAYAAVVYVDH